MNIKQFRYSSDNLAYLIYGAKEAIAIDGGAVSSIISFINDNNLILKYVTNTHSHYDHTTGNKELLDNTNAVFLEVQDIIKEKTIRLENFSVSILHTPGHTQDSICFLVDNILISGDTLFNGTVGNCFTGNVDEFVDSLEILKSLDQSTVIYAGHDYIRESMKYGKKIDPDNKNINQFLLKYNKNHVYSLLKDEFLINPFFRLESDIILNLLKQNGLPVDSLPKRFASLKSIEIW